MDKKFYDTWLPYVLTIVRRYGVAPSDRQDVVQDIFLHLLRKYEQYDERRGELRPWLRRVVISQVLQHLRSRHRFRVEDLETIRGYEPSVVAELQDLDAEYLIELIARPPDRLSYRFQSVRRRGLFPPGDR